MAVQTTENPTEIHEDELAGMGKGDVPEVKA